MSIKSQTPGIASDMPLMSKQRGPAYIMGKEEKEMPLLKSKSKEAIGENIKTEQEAGKPHKQAIAIALNTAREAGAHVPKAKETRSSHRHLEHR